MAADPMGTNGYYSIVPPNSDIDEPMPSRPTLRDRVRALIISNRVAMKSAEPLPPLRNRAEARKHIRARGPWMFGGIKPRTSNRRATTRQKRAEQRGHTNG